jgi:hypothetical protein
LKVVRTDFLTPTIASSARAKETPASA